MAFEKGNTEIPIRDFREHGNPADAERIEALIRKIVEQGYQDHQVLTHVTIADVPFRSNEILARFHFGGRVITQRIVLDARAAAHAPAEGVLARV